MDIQCKRKEPADILQYSHTHTHTITHTFAQYIKHTDSHIEASLNSQTMLKKDVGTESVLSLFVENNYAHQAVSAHTQAYTRSMRGEWCYVCGRDALMLWSNGIS